MAQESLTSTIVRWIIGAVFISSGLAKLADPESFYSTVSALQIMPARLEIPLVWFMPTLELSCGIALTANLASSGGLLIIRILLIVFSGVLSAAWMHGLNIRCGCFGSWLDWGSYPWWIGRNIALLFVSFLTSKSKI